MRHSKSLTTANRKPQSRVFPCSQNHHIGLKIPLTGERGTSAIDVEYRQPDVEVEKSPRQGNWAAARLIVAMKCL